MRGLFLHHSSFAYSAVPSASLHPVLQPSLSLNFPTATSHGDKRGARFLIAPGKGRENARALAISLRPKIVHFDLRFHRIPRVENLNSPILSPRYKSFLV